MRHETEENRKWRLKYERNQKLKQELSIHLIPAQACHYNFWLNRYLARGGKVTHDYDYNMPGDIFIATSNFFMPPFHGAQSFHVLVPKRIEVTHADLGHCELFLMRDFTIVGHDRAPKYADWTPCFQPRECQNCDCKIYCLGRPDAGYFDGSGVK